MARKARKAAYVVFIGRERGIFTEWSECDKQVHGFPGNSQRGYESYAEAEREWENHLRATQHALTAGGKLPTRLPASELLSSNLQLRDPTQDKKTLRKRTFDSTIDLTIDEPPQSAEKRQKSETGIIRKIVDFAQESYQNLGPGSLKPVEIVEPLKALQPTDMESPVVLTEAQQAVVDIALSGENIFLTGAAGSGKTVTLREMIRRLREKHPTTKNKNCPTVQVVAPTGIAALPLDGKTTYSFAGWKPDSLQQPLKELLENVKKSTIEAVKNLKVLIVEEVSMVENQFLERLDRLLGSILVSTRPFGGVQVVFVGDFHQLPPVKPFQNCMECGETMTRKRGYFCQASTTRRCSKLSFEDGDKWAFKAPVWNRLNLRHVKLEQIHRQKDTRFQDVLNKIRNGIHLEDSEWDELERPKELPRGAFAVRLMSLISQVNTFNDRELAKLKTEPKTWRALDVSNKKNLDEADRFPPRCHEITSKNKEFKDALAKYHRFPTELNLKVGAKVVLLYNLNPKSGLVNGSQGQVIGFANAESWPDKDEEGAYHKSCADEFTALNSHWRPIVQFANGKTQAIPHIVQDSTKISGTDRYHVARTQIPLALAWALSIHKSQGMTLQYAEVSSRSLFESGQLYVGVSRVTALDGLIVTGFSREKTTMDPDVLEFYKTTHWESMGPSDQPGAKFHPASDEEVLGSSSPTNKMSVYTPYQPSRHRDAVAIQDDEIRLEFKTEYMAVSYPSLSQSSSLQSVVDTQDDEPFPDIKGGSGLVRYPSLPQSSGPVVIEIFDSEDEGR